MAIVVEAKALGEVSRQLAARASDLWRRRHAAEGTDDRGKTAERTMAAAHQAQDDGHRIVRRDRGLRCSSLSRTRLRANTAGISFGMPQVASCTAR